MSILYRRRDCLIPSKVKANMAVDVRESERLTDEEVVGREYRIHFRSHLLTVVTMQ